MKTPTLSTVARHRFGQIAVFVFALCVHAHVSAQTNATRLDQSKEFNTESTALRGQLVDLARTYEIPMGLELLAGNDKPLKPLNIKNETALGVLGKILQAQPGYEFALSDGVVNVYSTRLFNDHKNFLNLIVWSYRINDVTLFGAWHYLGLAIKRTLHPDRSYGGGFGGVGGNSIDNTKLTFLRRQPHRSSDPQPAGRYSRRRLVGSPPEPGEKNAWRALLPQAYAMPGPSSSDFYLEFLPLR